MYLSFTTSCFIAGFLDSKILGFWGNAYDNTSLQRLLSHQIHLLLQLWSSCHLLFPKPQFPHQFVAKPQILMILFHLVQQWSFIFWILLTRNLLPKTWQDCTGRHQQQHQAWFQWAKIKQLFHCPDQHSIFGHNFFQLYLAVIALMFFTVWLVV